MKKNDTIHLKFDLNIQENLKQQIVELLVACCFGSYMFKIVQRYGLLPHLKVKSD